MSGPTISATISNGWRSPSASADAHLPEQLLDLAPRLGDLRLRFAEGPAVAGKAEVDLERLDLVEAAEEFAYGVGAVAVVEEQDRSPQQVVAGDHQLALGLVEDDVGGRVAGVSCTCQVPRSVSTSTPGRSSRSGSTIASIPVSSSPSRDSR